MDTTALLWDLTGGTQAKRPPSEELSAKQLDSLWQELAGDDAAKAYRAIWTLAAAPTSTTPFLQNHLKRVAAVKEERLSQLLRNLDSKDFDTREKAASELEKMAESAEPSLVKALKGELSIEARRRAEELLDKVKGQRKRASGERLLQMRALEVLENLDTAESRALIKDLGKGASPAWLTEEAIMALGRLEKRPTP
jgi:hypothetical protein